ncbi:OmpA family protein [Fibrella forsythiae]|uniref:OmpA family protein n=1 Tax=Fibrella forsythiae TaxID=2817061 RepID=A0ABS3JAX1_9BACT|nr:OmpA family protein [Fibrella forsythiae]MBO0947135.1 OmpA family protein [Fibrella forsythiae]
MTQPFLTRLTALWLLAGLWWAGSAAVHLFYIKRVGQQVIEPLPPLVLQHGPDWHTTLPGALFGRAGNELARSAHNPIDRLSLHLLANPGLAVAITGQYTLDEASATVAPDLGKARAAALADRLLTDGINEGQVQVRSERVPTLRYVNDSTGALVVEFTKALPTTARSLADAQRYIDLFHPMELYFESGQTTFIRTPETDRFVADAVPFLRQPHGAALRVTGHTDSVGSVTANQRLSMRRAAAVRQFLVNSGARGGRIIPLGRGSSEPIAPNATPEGRLANRRVTVVIKR